MERTALISWSQYKYPFSGDNMIGSWVRLQAHICKIIDTRDSYGIDEVNVWFPHLEMNMWVDRKSVSEFVDKCIVPLCLYKMGT